MKKVKLFTTIASLCLAVALMAFGVYAAYASSITVTGSIQFAATDISGSWTWATEKTVIAEGGATYEITESGDESNTAIEIVATTAGKIEFVVTGTFKNTSNKIAVLEATEKTEGKQGTFFTVSVIEGETVNSTGEATARNGETNGTGSVAMKVTCEIKDATSDIKTNDYSFAITFGANPKPAN